MPGRVAACDAYVGVFVSLPPEGLTAECPCIASQRCTNSEGLK
jgi:hypothetical protein